MSMDLTGITNKNEYYTNHYFSTVFEENAGETIGKWNAAAKESETVHTPWSMLRRNATQFYAAHNRYIRSSLNLQQLDSTRKLASAYLTALGYPEASPAQVTLEDGSTVPVYLELCKSSGAPLLWVILAASKDDDAGILESYAFDSTAVEEDATGAVPKGILGELPCEELATRILFGAAEPPRFVILISMNQIALIDRNKWNEKRYLQFELEEIFSRLENTTLQAMSVLLHKDSLCPEDGKVLLDELDEQSQKNASGVSQDLKYALRESIELLGNEVLYDMATRLGRNLEADPVDAGQLTLECLRYMYRMLFVLFIESRPELGYAPIKAQSYYSGYSLESLRDIADKIRDDVDEVGNGYYLHETLAKLYELIYDGYPKTEEELKKATGTDSLHDIFLIAPLKAHIFDPEYTSMITAAKLRNSCMLRIIDLMSLTRSTGKKNSRRGRISYANLGINQMGAVYEALLSYRGFIAEQDLYEVKRAGDSFNELDVGYFVAESELDQYTEEERVRYESGEKKGKLRMYEKGTFIYRLAGREREKSASYYTPEVLTKCLVKYALKELLEGKTADDILELTICEPAMGSAAFLNEAINQLAEAYISRKEQETGTFISYENRFNELQKVKMYIADRNVYGIDLNPVAVELAEVSLWLNTIYEGGYVPWFGTQLINGNSLIGARRQVYAESALTTSSKGMHWYENAPERVPLGTERKKRRGNAQIYHFLLGDPGMCDYTDKVIKELEPKNIKLMKAWNKKFTAPYSEGELESLRQLSLTVDDLWEKQVKLRQTVKAETQDVLSIFGHKDTATDSQTTIRQKDTIYSKIYKSEHMKNAGPYARLKFAMDYWCSLWFWPIDQAELLPSRSEFFNDLNLILVGTFSTKGNANMLEYQQLSLFPTEQDEIISKINELFPGQSEVDIDNLCLLFPRLALVRRIAEQNKFMHWELEFADLFQEHGGFDLVIGNPPWLKATWNQLDVLSEKHPIFAIRKQSASIPNKDIIAALDGNAILNLFKAEYVSMSGQQSCLHAVQNYELLVGQQTNLYRCFLPQAWMFGTSDGISAFIHQDGVFDDPNGGILRDALYPKLRRHYKFNNKFLLFPISTSREFSLNVYSNTETNTFECINNLFTPTTIDECYENDDSATLYGLKNDKNEWCISGHPKRIINVGKVELALFAKLFDNSDLWKQARLPVLHAQPLLNVLKCFAMQENKLASYSAEVTPSVFWDETNAPAKGIICRDVHFPENEEELIYSGAHIGVSNPLFKTSRENCASRYDFDTIDLTAICESYLPRCKYSPKQQLDEYQSNIPSTLWGTKITEHYKFAARKMLNLPGDRTFMGAILSPKVAHINGIISLTFKDTTKLVAFTGGATSIVFDFFIKLLGKQNLYGEILDMLPIVGENNPDILARTLMLNCLSKSYETLWRDVWNKKYCSLSWSTNNERLLPEKFSNLKSNWSFNFILKTDFERRQAQVELDILVAMLMGLTLTDLLAIYRIYFPVLRQNEENTWYDSNGRIVFTTNSVLTNVGFDRKQFELEMKDAPAGKKFYRTIMDDTMPGGPIERTIEYVAPFDRCDREQDYETAWKFFENKYGREA